MSSAAPPDLDHTARQLASIAAEAGRLLARVVDRGRGRTDKLDGSPTTRADLDSERLILERLAENWPAIPVVAEESALPETGTGLFFLVDPLDGTRDYLSGTGEYSVNIALVSGDRPVAAAIAAPANGRVWAAGLSAEEAALTDHGVSGWRPAVTRKVAAEGVVALVSRRHGDPETEDCLAAFPVAGRLTASSALKFCLIASGEADLYIRCGPTMEWDTAAGDHILSRAGGVVVGPTGPLTYGHCTRGFLNGPFAAFGDPSLSHRISLPATCS